MVDEKFTGEEINSRRGLTFCEEVKRELEKEGYWLFRYDGKVYLYGRGKNRQEVANRKEEVLGEYFYEVRSGISEQLGHSEKVAYRLIFERTRNFDRVIKSSNGILVSIQPYWNRPDSRKKYRKQTVSFIIRSKKQLPLKDIGDKLAD